MVEAEIVSVQPLTTSAPSAAPRPGVGGVGTEGKGDGFAALLSALAEHRASGTGVSAPAPVVPAHAAELARIFNENGFFETVHAAATAPAADGPDAQDMHWSTQSSEQPPVGEIPPEMPEPLPTAWPRGRPATTSASNGGAARGLPAPAEHAAQQPAANVISAASEAPPPVEITEAAAPDRARPLRSSPAAAEAARAALWASGGEVAVVARVNGLAPQERERLRQELVQLLGRHGFSLAALRLNGRVERISEA